MVHRSLAERFSTRTRWELTESRLSKRISEARARRAPFIDLTISNPTRCGLPPGEAAQRLLINPRAATYSPSAFGDPIARQAIADDALRRGAIVDPAHVVLSASTSESYAWLFSLLCDPGDVVLVPRPSYPLFEWLARLAQVQVRRYPLMPESSFRIDVPALASLIEARTRAILIVSPNNPTGSIVHRSDADAIETLAKEHDLSLIVDEVFSDYTIDPVPDDRLPTFLGRQSALTFVLDGLSKKLALPQWKLAWTIANGPAPLVAESLARLELIADTYLSVGAAPMVALPELFPLRSSVQSAIRARLSENLATLDRAITDHAASVGARRLPIDGGWSAVIEIPRTRDDEEWCGHLLDQHGVLVQPGYFYDFDRAGYVVVSLLPATIEFAEGARRLAIGLADT